jgi:hypothetical protein
MNLALVMAHKYRQDEIDGISSSTGLDMASATNGVRPSARNINTGAQGAQLAADGNNSTPVVTELYVAEIFVSATVLTTGCGVFAGSVWSDNFKVGLYSAAGVLLRATASTAGNTTADAYQRAAWATDGAGAAATTLVLPGPGTYYLGLCLDGTTSRYNTFAVGNFGAGKITGLVYATNFAAAGTALTITPPTTFTTALGPIAGLY